MMVGDLEEGILGAKRSGQIPIMVNAMCGSTVLGSVDPLDDIADLCEKYGIWMHVDGAWGGSILMSRDHRHVTKGIKRADSMTWNPHKMMGVPLQCSAILCRHKGILESANQTKADYLFQPDKVYDVSWDTGDKSIQCGRHNDIFKLWLMWRAKGDDGFEKQINHYFQTAQYLLETLKGKPGFRLLSEELDAPNVCFWYLPEAWRHLNFDLIPKEKLGKIAPTIKGRMMEHGTTLVQYQPLGSLPNLFRVAISNPIITSADVDFLVDEIERLGRDIPFPE
ncbi:hypothetical protein ACOMHN_004145 [Nucella lapillus]